MEIIVVGAGVIGLSAAHELAGAGHRVRVLAAQDTPHTTSAVTAALWFPHATEVSESAARLLRRSRERFDALVDVPEAAVVPRTGVVVERRPDADRSWTAAAPDARVLLEPQLPEGATGGVRATLPMIETPRYLPWLRRRVVGLGVRIESRVVRAVDDLAGEADAVVVAAGLGGGDLLGDDDTVVPVRGVVLRLPNPGLSGWITDVDRPDGLTHVFARTDDVVVGGVAEAGVRSLTVDAATRAGILARAAALVPELAGLPVLGEAAGLRPVRPTIRLEHVPGHTLPVVAAYGHGGAGVTLSWGTAERVVELVAEL